MTARVMVETTPERTVDEVMADIDLQHERQRPWTLPGPENLIRLSFVGDLTVVVITGPQTQSSRPPGGSTK